MLRDVQVAHFNPRSPCGERRNHEDQEGKTYKFQPTLPVRGATAFIAASRTRQSISTHAPRAGSDRVHRRPADTPIHFNPRSPCGERHQTSPYGASQEYFNPRSPCGERLSRVCPGGCPAGFQPTLPVRGATQSPTHLQILQANFNPRSPCGERPKYSAFAGWVGIFQPTLPVRGATGLCETEGGPFCISTHAPRAGSDDFPCRRRAPYRFQPTLPVRGATCLTAVPVRTPLFQPTLPVRGATHPKLGKSQRNRDFNPRSPCGERQMPFDAAQRFPDFNPRSPCGERRKKSKIDSVKPRISTHAPRAGSDQKTCMFGIKQQISTHAPRAGSDCKSAQIFLKKQVLLPINSCFYSRSRTAAAKTTALQALILRQ